MFTFYFCSSKFVLRSYILRFLVSIYFIESTVSNFVIFSSFSFWLILNSSKILITSIYILFFLKVKFSLDFLILYFFLISYLEFHKIFENGRCFSNEILIHTLKTLVKINFLNVLLLWVSIMFLNYFNILLLFNKHDITQLFKIVL